MKYLVLGCDVVGDCPLKEENELSDGAMPVELSPELTAELIDWNARMAGAVLALTEAKGMLQRLNAAGEGLAEQVAAAIAGGAKVRFIRE